MPISETDKIFAKSPYSATKIAADQIAASYYSSFGLPVTTVRPFNTYGPRQSNRAIIPTIITQILDGKKQIKLGSLYPTRDFSYIDDTVNGFVAAAVSNKSTGETFNIGAGYEISVGELFKVINKLCGSNSKIKTENIRVRPKSSEVHRLKADNRKAKKIINWKPLYSGKSGLIRGLKSTIEWFSEETNLKKYKTDHYIT
jgi:dTDP-glucose 4,6-dehydratase